MSRVLVDLLRRCKRTLKYSCGHTETHKDILVSKVYGFWEKMCDSLCMRLAFIGIQLTLQTLCHEYVLNYLNSLRCINVTLSRQRWLLSSCKQKTLLRKLLGIADGHIPLPKRQHQQDF